MREVVRWLWGLVASGLGRLKPDTTGSSHSGRLASDFSTFPLINNIIPWGGGGGGAKVQSDAVKDNPLIRLAGGYQGFHPLEPLI